MTGYDAFISYSHSADGKLAPAVQVGLQRLAKPWSKRRALEVFRDETGLAVNPDLWGSIVAALDSSEWFVLLASPEAAASKWVDQEIDRWLERSPDAATRILPVLTSGTMEWDEATGSFTPETDAAPPSLYRAFTREPRHIDLSWAKHEAQLDLGNPRFRQAIAEVAAPIHGVSQDELVGEDIRLHRKSVRLRRMAVAGLAVLTVGAVVASVVAIQNASEADAQRAEAEAQRAEAEAAQRVAEENAAISASREYAARSTSLIEDDTEVSVLLAVEAMWPDPSRPTTDFATDEAKSAVRNALNQLLLADSYRVGPHLDIPASVIAARPDGAALATIDPAGNVEVWDVVTGERLPGTSPVATAFVSTGSAAFWGEEEQSLAFSPDGTQLLVASDRLWALAGNDEFVRQPVVVDLASSSVTTLDDSAGPAAWMADGSIVSTPQDGSVVYRRVDASSPPEVLTEIATGPVTALVPLPSGALVVVDGNEHPWLLTVGAEATTPVAFADYERWNPLPHTDWVADTTSDTLVGFALGSFGADDRGVFSPPAFDVVTLDLGDPAATPAWSGSYPVAAGTLALSPDGAFLAAVNGEWELGLPGVASNAEGFGLELRVWSAASPVFGTSFSLPVNTAADIEWLPGGRVLAVASDTGVDFLQVGAHPAPAGSWALSAAAAVSRVLTWDGLASGVVSAWDPPASSPSARHQADPIEGEVSGDPIMGTVDLRPDGERYVAVGYGVPQRAETSGRVEFVELATGERVLLPEAPEMTTRAVAAPAAYDPSGTRIFMEFGERYDPLTDPPDVELGSGVVVVDAVSGAVVTSAAIEARSDVLEAHWDSDGTTVLFIVEQDSGRAMLALDVETGELQDVALPFEPNTFDVSSDGARLAVGLANGTVGIVDRGSGDVIRMLSGHSSRVTSVEFSESGEEILSADGALLLRSVETGEVIWSSSTVPAMTDQSWLLATMAPDQSWIGAGGHRRFAFIAGLDPALACRSVRADAFARLVAITGRPSACERIPELRSAEVAVREIAPPLPPPVVDASTAAAVPPDSPAEPPATTEVATVPAPPTPDLATIEVTCRTFTTNETFPIGLRQRGVTVAQVQLRLTELGFVLDVDGCYGVGSQEALSAFQAERGLDVSGVIDEPTWQTLTG